MSRTFWWNPSDLLYAFREINRKQKNAQYPEIRFTRVIINLLEWVKKDIRATVICFFKQKLMRLNCGQQYIFLKIVDLSFGKRI